MLTTLFLVRHGEVEERYRNCFKGVTDCSLSPKGVQQSYECANFLKGQSIDAVITTGLKRTDYIGMLLSQQAIRHSVDTAIKEMDFGLWEGKTWEEIVQEYPELALKYQKDFMSVQFPKGESIPGLRRRVIASWQILEKRSFSKFAIVGHAVVNACLRSYIEKRQIDTIEHQPPGSIVTLKLA